MRFVCNEYDPEKPIAKQIFYSGNWGVGEAWQDHPAWQYHLVWIAKFTKGRPQATAKYTVEQLEEMGFIGLYLPDDA